MQTHSHSRTITACRHTGATRTQTHSHTHADTQEHTEHRAQSIAQTYSHTTTRARTLTQHTATDKQTIVWCSACWIF